MSLLFKIQYLLTAVKDNGEFGPVAGAIVGGWFRVLFGGLWGSGDRLMSVFGWKICEWVGVKFEVLIFGATMSVLQGFEALCPKK